MVRSIQQFFAGYVSKRVLLTLLPLSIVAYFGTVIIASFYFPGTYHWSEQVISTLASPKENPNNYWLPCLGLGVSALLALPFAGYLEQRLRRIAPGLGRAAGMAFALALVLLLLTGLVVPQQVVQGFGSRTHEFFARGSAGAFALGMICCCICAFRDRLRIFGGQRFLGNALSNYWSWVTLLPVAVVAIFGILLFLGHQANQAWAEQARQSFRHTVMWNLAFWEWVGSVICFAFMAITVFLLPEEIISCAIGSPASGREVKVAEKD